MPNFESGDPSIPSFNPSEGNLSREEIARINLDFAEQQMKREIEIARAEELSLPEDHLGDSRAA